MRRSTTTDYTVACPLCGAKVGELCINIGHKARFGSQVHNERRWSASREASRGV